jgi:REP element-mobilizing transposase RayT
VGFKNLNQWSVIMTVFSQMFLHLVWSTKQRSNILRGPLEIEAHSAIRTTARDLGLVPICVNSAWTHTHLLISWNSDVLVDDAVENMKAAAVDAWEELMKQDSADKPKLMWQNGFSVFSVSPGKVQTIKQYVVKQKDLHRDGGTIRRYEPCVPSAQK